MALKRKSFGRVVSSQHNVFATAAVDLRCNRSIYQMSVPEPLRDSTVLSSFWKIVERSSQIESPIVDQVPTLHGNFVIFSTDSGKDRLFAGVLHTPFSRLSMSSKFELYSFELYSLLDPDDVCCQMLSKPPYLESFPRYCGGGDCRQRVRVSACALSQIAHSRVVDGG
jgi:hypothetical protein